MAKHKFLEPVKSFRLIKEECYLIDSLQFLLKNKKTHTNSENKILLNYREFGIEGCYDFFTKEIVYLNLRDDWMMIQYKKNDFSIKFSELLNLVITDPYGKYHVVEETDESKISLVLMSDRQKEFLHRILKPTLLRVWL